MEVSAYYVIVYGQKYMQLFVVRSIVSGCWSGAQRYIIKPKPTPIYFNYASITSGFKYTNCASAFTAEAPGVGASIGSFADSLLKVLTSFGSVW